MSIDVWFWVIWILAGGVVLAWLVRRRIERKRTEAIHQASLHLGMTFLADDKGLAKSFVGFALLQKAKAKNVLRGSSGDRGVALFDCEYFMGEGCVRQTVAAFRLPADVPEFSMSPKNILDRIGGIFGMQYINFETYQEFSRRYRLRGKEEAAIRELFRPQVLNYFTQKRGWSLEGGHRWLLIYRADKRVAPQDLSAFLQQTTRIAHMFRDGSAAQWALQT